MHINIQRRVNSKLEQVLNYYLNGEVGSFIKYLLNLFPVERESCYSSCGSELLMDTIEISSSDSDVEIEDGRGHVAPTGSRVLPMWGATANGNSRIPGSSGQSQLIPATGRANGYGASSSANHAAQTKAHADRISYDDGPSSSHVERSKYPPENENTSQPQTINSRISSSFAGNYEKLSSQQALRRTLPSSLQSPVKLYNLEENKSSRHIGEALGKSHQSSWSSSMDSRAYMRDHSSRAGADEVQMFENRANRILPPSLMLKTASASAFANPSDSMYRPVMGDERTSRDDERLIYQAALEDLNQPKTEASIPNGLLSVPLFRHQKIALAWMLQKENRSLHCLGGILADDQGLGKTISMIALIQMQKSMQPKSKAEDMPNHKPEALNLDDDDDNGTNGLDKHESDDCKPIPEASTSTRTMNKRRPAAGTLVVCPASVLRQWARELDDKVAEESKLSVLVYHGATRTKDPAELAKYDVVVTTYSIVTIEVPKQPLVDEDDFDEKNGENYGLSSAFNANKKRKKATNVSKKGKKGRKGIESNSFECGSGPLAKVGWFRVILDEAQTIKNHRTQVARACCSLRAKRRWCLSGTPIQNTIDDLYSYFRFLKYEPYGAYKSFYFAVKIPISRNALHGYKKLQAILRAVMLRRTKSTLIDGQPIITLPPKSIHLSKTVFSLEERDFYTQLENQSRTQFKAYAAAGTVKQNYASILLMLLRLRQACDHPSLVKGYCSDPVGKASAEMARKLPRDMLINLLNLLEEPLCRVCNDPAENPVVTMCGHVFCYQCVSEYLTGDDNMCPAHECKQQLGDDVVFSKATLRSCMEDDFNDNSVNSHLSDLSSIMQNTYSSSKIKAVIEILQSQCIAKSENADVHSPRHCDDFSFSYMENCQTSTNVMKHTTVYSRSPTEGPIKAIVFSQWTGMLDLVEDALNQNFIQHRRLDGTMTLSARDKAVKEFNTDPEITVMLMSLKAGNLGLNMVAACHVILLDLWWNPTTEDQAIDRAHRIGQTRPVTVTRITIKDTVEDRILALQEEKRKMVASAFGDDQGGSSATRLTVEDLKYLFMI